MANIFGAYQSTQTPGAYLTPRTTFGAQQPGPGLTASQSYGLAGGVQYDKDHWAVQATKYVGGGAIDIVDGVAAIFGQEREATNSAFWNGIGQPGMAKWVDENHGGVEIASGIMGAVITGAAAEMALVKVAGSAWFAATGVGRAAKPLVNAVANARHSANEATKIATAAGGVLPWNAGANLRLVGTQVGINMGKAAVSEVAIVAAMHKNSAVWSDDMSNNIVMGALGIAVPGLAGGIFARGSVQRWANSDEIRLVASEAVDTAGLQRSALAVPASTGKANPRSVMAVSPSYLITTLSLDSRLDDAGAAATRGIEQGGSRGSVKTEVTHAVQDLMQQMTTKGADAVPESSFSMFKSAKSRELTPSGRHLVEAIYEDPTLMLGARGVAVVDDPMAAIAAREAEVARIDKKPGAYSKKELELKARIKTDIPMVLVGKRWMTVADSAIHTAHKNITELVTKSIKGVQELSWKSSLGKTMRVREDGRLNLKWSDIADEDLLSARDGMNEQLRQMKAKKTTLIVPKDASYMELDYAIEYSKRGGEVNFAKAAGLADAGEAALESLRKKSMAINPGTKLDTKTRIRLNLPLPTSVERVADPDGVALKSILKAASAKGIGLEDLKKIREDVTKQFDLTTDSTFDNSLDGDFFNFGLSRDGKPLAPVMGFFKDVPAAKWSRFDLQEAMMEGQATRMSQLIHSGSKFAAALTESILQFPGHKLIADVTGLTSGQVAGIRGGVGAVASQFLTQAFRFRNNPTLLAAQQMKRVVNRVVELQINSQMKRLSPFVEQMTSVTGARSKVLMDSYLSLAGGWDIKSVRQMPDGTLGFVLDHESANNFARMNANKAEVDWVPMKKGQMLMNPRTGKEVVLDQIGNAMRIEWEAVANELLSAQNAVRKARGLDPIKKRHFYVPPKSTRGKYIGFVLGPDNKVVAGGAVVANTPAEFDRLALQMEKDIAGKPGMRFMAQEEIARFSDLWESADMDFIDPTAMAGPRGPSKGGLTSEFLDPTSIERMLGYVKSGYESLGNGVTRTVFDPQMRLAAAHDAAARSHRPVQKGVKTIHQIYQETLMGMPASMNPTGVSGVLNQVDEVLDGFIEKHWGGAAVTKQHLQSILEMAGYPMRALMKGKGRKDFESFEALTDALADKMPFKSAEEYAEYTLGLEVPWKTRELARGVNRFGTAAILRWGEIPHAAMNMAGIITNMPGLIGAKNVPLVGRVQGVGVIDTTKIMARGFKRMMSEGDKRKIGQKLSPDFEHMVRNGDTSQDAAELDIAMSLLKPGNHSGWRKFMFGDPTSDSWWKQKGVDGAVSVMTDTSESMSRRWAHFVGLELADYHGVVGMEARHNFARQTANDAIANYDAWNRPEIYQNAFGSMYGLFLSYAQNYYQRIWSFMEVGDYKAMGRTLAIQSAMFGFTGMPGARQLASLIGGEEEGEGLVDGIYERFGPAVGSVVAQGGFNQLTTLFGLPAMALHTRGDVNFRHPSIDTLTTGSFQMPVGLEVIKDLAQGTIETLGALAGPGGGRQAGEVMARHMPSRMLAGAMEQAFSGGQAVDSYGNVVSETKSTAEAVFRILGVRSARQQGEIEAYFLNQRSMQIDAQRMDSVRTATRAIVRAGDFDKLPAIFEKYLENGGKPWNYANWIENIIEDANGTRAQNQLLRSMRNPSHQDLARRIEIMTAAY